MGLISLKAANISPGKQDDARLSGFAFFCFIIESVRTKYLPSDRLLGCPLLYVCFVFPRSWSAADDGLCHQENGAPVITAPLCQHRITQSCAVLQRGSWLKGHGSTPRCVGKGGDVIFTRPCLLCMGNPY